MANLTVTASKVSAPVVIEQLTLPTSVAVTAGQVVRVDLTSGQWVLAQATAAPNATNVFIALSSGGVGAAITAIRRGYVNLGTAMDALALGASVYLSDTAGTLADVAGTVSTVLGKVFPAFGSGANIDRLLRVDIAA